MDPATGYSIFVVILGIVGFLLNLSLIVTVYKKVQKKSSFHHTLVSLSCADILSTIGSTTYGVLILFRSDISYFKSISVVALFVVYFSNLVSFLHIIFIAVLRALATIYPLKFKSYCAGYHFLAVILLVWLLSAAFLLLVTFQVFHFLVIGYVGIVTCVILIFLYLFICLHVRRQQHGVAASSSQRRAQRISLVVLKHSIAVTITFIVCFVPSAIFAMLKFPGHFVAFAVVTCLLVLNPLIDPLLYFFVSHCKMNGIERSQNVTPIQIKIGSFNAASEREDKTFAQGNF